MNPKIPDELISAYFDGEVTPEESRRVEEWLQTSPDLRQWLDDTSKLSALLHSFPREAVPVDLSANVQRQIESIRPPRSGESIAVPKPQPAQQNRANLRREWTAFGAGILATVASVFFVVAIRPSVSPVEVAVARNGGAMTVAESSAPIAEHDARDMAEMAGVSLGGMGGGMISGLMKTTDHSEMSDSDDIADAENAEVGLLATNADENSLQPQPTSEFLDDLKNGDVKAIEQHHLDPNSVVAVVEISAHDVNRGVAQLESLLSKRQSKRIEGGESAKPFAANVAKPAAVAVADSSKEKSTSSDSDEVGLLFVRAPGAQLAETLLEAINENPEIYIKLSPKLPVEFPHVEAVASNLNSREAGNASESVKKSQAYFESAKDRSLPFPSNKTPELKSSAAAPALPAVNYFSSSKNETDMAEATCATNLAAMSNGFSVSNLSPEVADRMKQITVDHMRYQNQPVGTILNSDGIARDQHEAHARTSDEFETRSSATAAVCYTTFRGSVDKSQTSPAEPQAAPRSKSAQLKRTQQQLNQSWLRQDGEAARHRAARAAEVVPPAPPQSRDTQLMRMVIIVKKPDSESPNP